MSITNRCNVVGNTCSVCLSEFPEGKVVCPLAALDTSHQGRDVPPAPSAVSSGPATATGALEAEVAPEPPPVTGNVVHIGSGRPVVPDEVTSAEIVDMLEDLVERAKSGLIRSCGVVFELPGGSIATNWKRSEGGSCIVLLGATMVLAGRLQATIEDAA